MKFFAHNWQGNGWSAIDVEPVDEKLFRQLLRYLTTHYQVDMPVLHPTLDGFYADGEILETKVSIHADNWCCSIAFEDSNIRDEVLTHLSNLPPEKLSN